MKLLYFARPAGIDFFTKIIDESVLKDTEKFYITEFYQLSKQLPNCLYLKNSPERITFSSNHLFSDSEIYDIIIRDRLLSKIEFNKAINLAFNAVDQILKVFEEVQPDIVIVKDLDTYTNDIFIRIAQKLNIFNFFLVVGPKGTMKFYNYNTPYIRKEPYTEFDLFEFMEERSGNIFRKLPHDNVITRMKMMYGHYKQKIKQTGRNNPDIINWNTHNAYLKYNVRVAPHLNFNDINKHFYQSINQIPKTNLPKIFISLHFYPEATINYFSPHNSLIHHDEIVLSILKRCNKDFHFIIKEHPEMFNKRSLQFYRKLKQFKNSTFIHPYISSYDVIEKSDFVLSWAGSIGWEAPFLGRKTINVIRPYYFVDKVNNHFENINDLLENFKTKIEDQNYDIKEYCTGLNKSFRSFSYKGIPIEIYDNEENRKDIANSLQQFLIEQDVI